MKKVVVIILALVFALSLLVYHSNNNPKTVIAKISEGKIDLSKALRYRIYLLGVFPVAQAFLEREEPADYKGKQVYRLTATAEPAGFFAGFIKGGAHMVSYIDKQQLLPLKYEQALSFFDTKEDKEVFYDQVNHTMELSGVERKTYPQTYDPLSLFLNLRRMELGKKNGFQMNINTNQKNYLLNAGVAEKELRVRKQKHVLFIINTEIKRRDKSRRHKTGITMLLLKGEENIPLIIKIYASGIIFSAKLIP